MPAVRRTASAAAAAALMLATAACSTGPDLSAKQAAACDALIDAPVAIASMPGGPEAPPPSDAQLAKLTKAYSAIAAGTTGKAHEAADMVATTLTEVAETKNYALMDDEAFFGNAFVPMSAGRSLCEYDEVDVSIKEHKAHHEGDNPKFSYVSVPKELDAGTYSFKVKNGGKNFHEALIVKIDDSFKGGVKELTQLSDEEAEKVMGKTTITFAAPGQTGYVNATLGKGKYLVYCHIPLMGENEEVVMGERGPIWHFNLGMAELVTVS